MQILKAALLSSSFVGVTTMVMSTQAVSAPGNGWDTYHSGLGDPIVATTNADGVSNTAGKGWDVFKMGMGQPIPDSGDMEKSQDINAGKGWDTYNMGLGQRF